MSSTETPDVTADVPPLDEEVHEVADRIVRRYPVARSALLPLLHLVQSAQNHITDEGIAFCAEKVGLTRAEVGAVATFYTMYKREPVGDWLLSVCTNPVCKQAGGQEILDNYVEALGGHSDPGTKVTVEHAECLGICDGAPVVQVNYEMFGPMTVAEGQQLLESCRRGDPPVSPWSGEKPPTFAEVERDLSGANDAWEDQLHLAALQQIAFDSPPTYRTGETDLPVTHPGGDPAGVGGAAFRAAASGEGATAVGHPEAPVDADEGDPERALAGDTAQRVGEEAGDVEGEAGTPAPGDADVPVEEAVGHVDLVPGDAEALTTEARPDSSTMAGDARETQPPTTTAGDADYPAGRRAADGASADGASADGASADGASADEQEES
jgi:NADH-quinone oxidoreductase subunit E